MKILETSEIKKLKNELSDVSTVHELDLTSEKMPYILMMIKWYSGPVCLLAAWRVVSFQRQVPRRGPGAERGSGQTSLWAAEERLSLSDAQWADSLPGEGPQRADRCHGEEGGGTQGENQIAIFIMKIFCIDLPRLYWLSNLVNLKGNGLFSSDLNALKIRMLLS